MDWRLAHFLNGLLRGHGAAQDAISGFASWSVPLFALATVALWLLARPYGPRRLKLASASALASAGLALLLNQAIAHVWLRQRPYVPHPDTLLLASPSHDPSFPSDHAAAAFAIAFAVLVFSRRLGAVFLLGAAAVSLSRVLVGLHYPGDVLGGAATGLVSAVAVTRLGRPVLARAVALAGRLTDPCLAPLWRLGDAFRARLPYDRLRHPPYGWHSLSLVGVLVASLLSFGHLAEDYLTSDPIVTEDHRLALWFHLHASSDAVAIARVVTLSGNGPVLGVLVLVAASLFLRRKWRADAALVVSAYLASELLTALLKLSFHRERPEFDQSLVRLHTYSFPSGHAAVSTAVYGALLVVWLERRRTTLGKRAAAVCLTASLLALVGGSRLVLDVHYLSDVLAGYSLGLACLAACALVCTVGAGLGGWRSLRRRFGAGGPRVHARPTV